MNKKKVLRTVKSKLTTVIKKTWNDSVGGNVISGLIIFGLITLGSYFLGWLPIILNTLTENITMPLWLILLVGILPLFLKTFFGIFFSEQSYDFEKYTSDRIFDIDWEWKWEPPNKFRSDFKIKNLKARCPKCKTLLEPQYHSFISVLCTNENCDWFFLDENRDSSLSFSGYEDLYQRVDKEIDRKVHTKEWKAN